MTIKRQIFISNIRTVLVTLFGLLFVGIVFRFVMLEIMGVNFEEDRSWREQIIREMEYEAQDRSWVFGPVFTVLFIVLISGINNLLNYRLIKTSFVPCGPWMRGSGRYMIITLASA